MSKCGPYSLSYFTLIRITGSDVVRVSHAADDCIVDVDEINTNSNSSFLYKPSIVKVLSYFGIASESQLKCQMCRYFCIINLMFQGVEIVCAVIRCSSGKVQFVGSFYLTAISAEVEAYHERLPLWWSDSIGDILAPFTQRNRFAVRAKQIGKCWVKYHLP